MEQSPLRAEIGGIPAWQIGIGLAAVIVGWSYWRGRGRKPTGTTEPTEPLVGNVDDQAGYGLPSGAIGTYLGNDPTNPAYPTGMTPRGIPGPVTNEQWARLAFDELVSKGDDPSLVATALWKYINSNTLSPAENAVVNMALQLFGAPPEGVIPVNTGGSGGTPTPGTPPGNARRYVIVARWHTPNPPWNSYLEGIAQHFGVTVQQLVTINHISNPRLIYTGQKIWIDP
jgi:LysM domain-containing protein